MDEQRAWIRSRRRKRLRIVAVILCMCLLATTRADILATLSTFASEWKDRTVYVSGFGELPESVREQTVPLGTGVEELSLPDTLEAFAETTEEEDKPVDADKPGDGSGETGKPDDGEGGTGNPGDGSGETGNPHDGEDESGNTGEGSDDGNGDAGNADEGTGGTGEAGDGTGESGNTGEGSDGESGDAGNPSEETDGESGDAGNTDEGKSNAGESDGDSSGSEPESSSDSAPADDEGDVEAADEMAKGIDGALTVQRGVFVMPVYLSESVAIAEPQTMERKKESVMIKGVTWQSEPAYDGDTEGTYLFTAVLPEGYALAEGLSLPQITVTVQGTDPMVQELLARIAALPEAEEYLADEPDVETEEEYETWMDGLSTYTAEALDLWEMYETFTEEQRAQVPTEALVRLAAWVELAGQLAEGIAVTAEVEAETIPITVNLWRNGARWGGQEISLKCDGKYYPTEERDTGVYTGAVERGGTCYACLNGNESSIGSLGVSTNGPDGTLTFRYVTVTYKNDGATGTVPEEESYYCGRVNRNTPMQYNVNLDLPLTKPGYVQTGWSETSGGSGEAVTEITVNQGTGDETGIRTTPIVLYPVFTPATVTIHATNCIPEGIDQNEGGVYETTVGESGDYSVTFKPDSLYNVPAGVTVEIGGMTLASGDYIYTNGKLTIPRSKITGNVTITAEAEAKPFTITVELLRNGTGWSGQNVTARRDGVHYPMEETETAGIYKGDYERGGNYFPCLDGKSIGGNYVNTDGNGSASTFHFRYVTVTYKVDGATGTVPEEESYYCGLPTNTTKYTVKKTLPLTKAGYVQTGWSETSGGSGETATEITVNQGTGVDGIRTTPIILYPVFTPAAVTINATNCTNNGAAVVGSGDYTVTFTPEDGYHVPKTVTVQIGSTTLGSGEYTYINGKLTIPRSKITGNVTITANASSEHSLTYTADNAQGTITESCDNGCTHSATVEFETFLTAPYTYTGNAIEPFGVKYAPAASAWLGTVKPKIGYTNNTNAGTATATLTAGSESVSKTFTIVPKSLEDASVTATLGSDSYPYTGKAIEPAVTVSDSAIGGGTTLVKDRDYTVTYADNTAVGTNTAKVTVTGTGNYTGVRTLTFTIQDKAPDVSGDDLDFSGGTVKLPDDIKDEVEIYDSDGNKITPNPDGSLPVEPGSTITIKYPGSDKETVITLPGRPAAPAPKQVTVTGTTATISDPITGEEYVLVARGATLDWSKSQTDTTFAGLTPNTEYDLFVRKQATSGSFASEPAKTEIRTSVTIKEPEVGGAGAGEPGNTVSKPENPDKDGDSVTYTGTCEDGYTPVIKVGDKNIIPDITWDADGKKGTWTYTVPIEDGAEAGIEVEFRDRAYTGLMIEPDSLHIYADDSANQSADKLLDYLRTHCTVKAAYDNGTSDDATNGADYTTQTDFAPKSAVYEYTVEAAGNEGNPGKITLSVSSVNAAVETQVALTRTKQSGGYDKAEVDAWLPEKVTVTYTGDGGYAQRTESRSVIWNTDALGAGFGSVAGSKTISGTVDMPVWATGGNTASIGIEFVDRNILTDAQMNLSISGWAYGAQTAPAPKGSVTVTDTEQTYSYRYSADNGRSWVAADGLPKSGSGNIIPGDYQVEMTYSGRNYTGTKTAAFTVVQKPVTAEKGTRAVENRNYDGTTKATLKAGGKPALVGAVANDDVSLSGTLNAVFTNKGPKKNIPVTVTGFALTGGDAGYYKLVNTTLTLKATINNKDGSAPSSGSSSGNTSGEDSGIGENEGDSGDNGNSGNTGSDGSSGSSGNNGTGGNGTGTGSTGSGNTGGNGKGSTGSGDTTGTGKGTSETGKGGTGKDNAGGTGKGAGGDGSSTGKGTIGNGGTGNSGNGGTGKSATSGTGNGTTGSGRDNTGSGTGNGDAGAQQTGNGQQTKSVTVQTVQAAADDGRIVISGETEAPVAIGTLTEDAPGATRLLVGEGTVTVTVVCEDDQYTVGMNDATAVANAVLTPEQIQRVDAGESLEIRVDIKNISQSIPPQDRETVEKGYEAYGKYFPELMRGGYVDISVYMKTGDGGWNAVSETMEPLEVVIGIPEELRGDGREYYIIRAHEGRYTLLNDMDAVPETITIVTDLFSCYAIAYREAGGANTGNGGTAYGLFQVSPKFLGIVSLIWLTVAAGGILVVIIVLRRKRSSEKETVV